jgi:hypothetical protein
LLEVKILIFSNTLMFSFVFKFLALAHDKSVVKL